MGTCKYCKKPAGLLRSQHSECREAFEEGKQKLLHLVSNVMKGLTNNAEIEIEASRFANQWTLGMPDIKPILIDGWSKALDVALEDGVISHEEEKKLVDLQEFFGLSQKDVDEQGAYTKLVKSCVLREVMNGEIPEAFQPEGNLPVNLQRGEKIVWGFQPVQYYEQKNRTQYVGGSSGVSVRIAKGVYFRTSAFKGSPIVTTQTIHIDTGLLLATDRNIYFAGPTKSFRIPYGKIVSYQPFSDGISLCRDTASAKPQVFRTGDGWFTYNLLSNLGRNG
jgi:hypothetical protein